MASVNGRCEQQVAVHTEQMEKEALMAEAEEAHFMKEAGLTTFDGESNFPPSGVKTCEEV